MPMTPPIRMSRPLLRRTMSLRTMKREYHTVGLLLFGLVWSLVVSMLLVTAVQVGARSENTQKIHLKQNEDGSFPDAKVGNLNPADMYGMIVYNAQQEGNDVEEAIEEAAQQLPFMARWIEKATEKEKQEAVVNVARRAYPNPNKNKNKDDDDDSQGASKPVFTIHQQPDTNSKGASWSASASAKVTRDGDTNSADEVPSQATSTKKKTKKTKKKKKKSERPKEKEDL